jgi:phospholipid/cholesterol/gamma-HCH transport system substrate-binding protein
MKQVNAATSTASNMLNENKSDLRTVVANFKKVSSDFTKISDSLNKADLGKTFTRFNSTLTKVDAILADLHSGKGSAGKLLKDDNLYNNLKATTKEMELLLQDVRLYPTRYINVSVFGKKNKPYVGKVNDSISKEK